ncbi:MAG: ATP-dependent Clp protease ATP-binding subunit [Lachnospiraceae bacterium]|nr:ATP-dependent Clp protease ATP-binding subunit [Lachnospiraceae bacterium]
MEYTKQLKKAIDYSKRVSKKLGHNYIGTEHLLLGLLRQKDTLTYELLTKENITEEHITQLIFEYIAEENGIKVLDRDGYTPKLEALLAFAESEAKNCKSKKVGTEHILMAILRTPECAATRLLASMDVNLQKLFTTVLTAMGQEGQNYREETMSRNRSGKNRQNALELYSRNLSQMAAEGKLDPIIGRENEIQRVIQILSRRGKNNPCLIGEPGVGKTAIVEGLAERIETGAVPDSVRGKRLLTLDLSGMVAGSKYRGEFEERIKNVLREVKESGDVILFIDEIHTLIGAGGAEGSIDAANMLKPAMARGEIQVIGATTVEEYRKHIEKDAALERRFQPVMVEEPSVEETILILQGIKSVYEDHHGITISDEAIEACTTLSERYISDRFLPDKAIDLMDESAAKIRLQTIKTPEHLYEMEEEWNGYDEKIEAALIDGDIKEASRLRKEQAKGLEKIEKEKKKLGRSKSKKQLVLTYENIADVVSVWTKIPVAKLTESETNRLNKLEATLHKRVIGQNEAVSAVSRAVRRGRVGLKEPGRPIGSFLFLGPTGVGKTEVSKALAEAVFGSEESMIRVDMTEYMEKHSVSKMIGSPPGYVGYDEGGQLSEKVRRNPYSVILFDEIEKAHPDVFNILLQVLDEGHITDSQGRKVDFKNTIIIMTSNAGAKEIMEPKHLGFLQEDTEKQDYEFMKSRVQEELKHNFKPEFLNRIDETIVFRALNKDDMTKIVSIMTKSLVKRCKDQMDLTLVIRPSVKKYIVEKAYDPKFGARPLRRKIQTDIEDALAEELLSGKFKGKKEITVTVKKDIIVFEGK